MKTVLTIAVFAITIIGMTLFIENFRIQFQNQKEPSGTFALIDGFGMGGSI